MKAILNFVVFNVTLFLALVINAGGILATNFDGGTVITDLGGGIKVNEKSSLHRTWTVINDQSCPVQLSRAGITTDYSGQYYFSAKGSATASKPIRAVEIRFALYDVFGRYLMTLTTSDVFDLSTNSSYQISGRWNASEDHVSGLLHTVAFVTWVREADGRVWQFSQTAVEEELARLQLKSTAASDVPTKNGTN